VGEVWSPPTPPPPPPPPDLVLDASLLGSVYLGGVSFELLREAGRLRELTPGACRQADVMFREDPAPYSGTMF
jgi:hypothetical protein